MCLLNTGTGAFVMRIMLIFDVIELSICFRTEYIAESQPDALASSSDSVPVDTAKACSRPDNFECRLPPEKNNQHQDNSSSNSHPDSESEGQRLL